MRTTYRPFFAFAEAGNLYRACIIINPTKLVMATYVWPTLVILVAGYTLLTVTLFACIRAWPDFLNGVKSKPRIIEMCGGEF